MSVEVRGSDWRRHDSLAAPKMVSKTYLGEVLLFSALRATPQLCFAQIALHVEAVPLDVQLAELAHYLPARPPPKRPASPSARDAPAPCRRLSSGSDSSIGEKERRPQGRVGRTFAAGLATGKR